MVFSGEKFPPAEPAFVLSTVFSFRVSWKMGFLDCIYSGDECRFRWGRVHYDLGPSESFPPFFLLVLGALQIAIFHWFRKTLSTFLDLGLSRWTNFFLSNLTERRGVVQITLKLKSSIKRSWSTYVSTNCLLSRLTIFKSVWSIIRKYIRGEITLPPNRKIEARCIRGRKKYKVTRLDSDRIIASLISLISLREGSSFSLTNPPTNPLWATFQTRLIFIIWRRNLQFDTFFLSLFFRLFLFFNNFLAP